MATIEFSVDLLAKKQNVRGKPREIDTNRLANDVVMILEHQPFEAGRTLALDFEGTKLELTVKECGVMALEDDNETQESKHHKQVGRLIAATSISFSRAEGATAIALVGDHVQGGGSANTNLFLSDFDFEKLGIGGLEAEFNTIFRRAFASRILPPQELKIGLVPCPGHALVWTTGVWKNAHCSTDWQGAECTGTKNCQWARDSKQVCGWIEEKIRELFADAEKEQLEAGDQSMLHIVIMDEMDAICKSRGTVRDGTGVSDSVVNQLLSKIDGVDSLNNILLIGMTNRKDMIDDALLRPGRLEVHVEIGLPDLKGRMQILNIHTPTCERPRK